MRRGIDVSLSLQIRHRQSACYQAATFIHQLVHFAVQQDAPVEDCGVPLSGGSGHVDVGSAVVSKRVVPLGRGMQFVGALEIVEKDLARQLRTGRGAKDIHLLIGVVPVICTQADDVALIGDNVGEHVLTIEASNRGVALADFIARLNGHRNVALVTEIKADDGMGD